MAFSKDEIGNRYDFGIAATMQTANATTVAEEQDNCPTSSLIRFTTVLWRGRLGRLAPLFAALIKHSQPSQAEPALTTHLPGD